MTKRIRKLLIANRGEISVRITRTCRKMGIATVAIFSDADENAPFVRMADEAVRIGPAPSAESYLRVDRILEAARRTGADAIHPGFGFLAENADFAARCESAGFIWVGPSADAITAMGSKIESKRRMTAAGVPVIPGYGGDEQSTEALAARVRELGFPVLLKASAGGGGKGMRLLRDDSRVDEEIDAARREGERSFGDGTLLIERYIDNPRHVEIQVFGDAHGNVVYLFERECSIQRRHQKIIEEAPSVALTPALRVKMGEAAVAAARAVDYQNAGTVEFILGPDGAFYFLEMNTRLQVEHPVSECITGLDLVREQIRVAEGAPLSVRQEDLHIRGAAVECRIYAEDPAAGFLPSTGVLMDWHVPEREGLRVDAGVETGSEVSIHYDPMLAKVITWGEDRAEATQRMVGALRQLSAQGVTTNTEFLIQILTHPEYEAGKIDTHFIERHYGRMPARQEDPERDRSATFAAALAAHLERRSRQTLLPSLRTGFRNNPSARQRVEYRAGEQMLAVEYDDLGRGRFRMSAGGGDSDVRLLSWNAPVLVLEVDGLVSGYRVVGSRDRWYVHSPRGSLALAEQPRFPERLDHATGGRCVSPMPGKVLRVHVEAGDVVRKGDVIAIVEAMKMEHAVTAPHDATIRALLVTEGDQVDADAPLAELEELEVTTAPAA